MKKYITKIKRKKFIKNYIIKYETKDNILAYIDGSMDYDDDYLKEVATDMNVEIIDID